jgi:hypothetical protein
MNVQEGYCEYEPSRNGFERSKFEDVNFSYSIITYNIIILGKMPLKRQKRVICFKVINEKVMKIDDIEVYGKSRLEINT